MGRNGKKQEGTKERKELTEKEGQEGSSTEV